MQSKRNKYKPARKGRHPREEEVQGTLPSLVAAMVAGLLPLIPHLSPWIPLWCFGFWGYAALSEPRGWPLPRSIFRTGLTLLGLAGVFITAGGVLDNTFGAGLLCVMAGLKTLEVRRERDLFITIFIAYFMVVSSLFFSASLLMTLYMVAAMIHITAILLRLNSPGVPLTEAFKVSGAITAKAIPLTMVLFFFFPRIDGNLFGITSGKTATSGFSNTLSPGSVSQMALSNEPVFRVTFDGPIPPSDKRYFRGIVFQEFNGRAWRATSPAPSGAFVESTEGSVSYEVIFETKAVDRFFPLDLPTEIPRSAGIRADFTLKEPKGGIKETPYRFRSSTLYNTGSLNRWESVFFRVPDHGNPRSRRLARQWWSESERPEQIVEKALGYLADNDFFYTLKPPALTGDIVDSFLFETRRGFCEHYASAFTFLMRSAGIPARIVGGYLGGTINPFGNYLIMRQSDAHAWAEVWIEGKGWIRVDPTSAVAPERVQRGAGFGLPAVERPSFFVGDGASFISRGLDRLRLGWDSLNYQWDSRVIGYSFKLQTDFLKKLGITNRNWKGWLKTIAWVVALCGATFGLAWLVLELRSVKRKPSVQASWHLFLNKLKAQGITRHPATGPLDFLDTIKREHPHLYPDARAITQLYVTLTYGKEAGNRKKLSALKRAVNRFTPQKTTARPPGRPEPPNTKL